MQSLLEQLPEDDPDYIYNMGCLLYQDGKYEEACKKFTSAMQVLGYVPGTCLSCTVAVLVVGFLFLYWAQIHEN